MTHHSQKILHGLRKDQATYFDEVDHSFKDLNQTLLVINSYADCHLHHFNLLKIQSLASPHASIGVFVIIPD